MARVRLAERRRIRRCESLILSFHFSFGKCSLCIREIIIIFLFARASGCAGARACVRRADEHIESCNRNKNKIPKINGFSGAGAQCVWRWWKRVVISDCSVVVEWVSMRHHQQQPASEIAEEYSNTLLGGNSFRLGSPLRRPPLCGEHFGRVSQRPGTSTCDNVALSSRRRSRSLSLTRYHRRCARVRLPLRVVVPNFHIE